jgi:hypothetical protein
MHALSNDNDEYHGEKLRAAKIAQLIVLGDSRNRLLISYVSLPILL